MRSDADALQMAKMRQNMLKMRFFWELHIHSSLEIACGIEISLFWGKLHGGVSNYIAEAIGLSANA